MADGDKINEHNDENNDCGGSSRAGRWSAQAQLGWTLDQCRKHWGRETSIEHPYLDESRIITGTTYVFSSKIRKEVTLDQQGKVNDVSYLEWEDDGLLNIPALLAREKAIIWEVDPDQTSGRHTIWIGKKDGIEVFHTRDFYGHNKEATRWSQYLQILPIDRSLWGDDAERKKDADLARANAARIEAEERAKAAAGPTEEEKRQAAHDAEIRESNERALKAASNGQ